MQDQHNSRGAESEQAPSWILDLRQRLASLGRDSVAHDGVTFLVPLFVHQGSLWTILGEDVVTTEGELARISFPAAQQSADESTRETAVRILDEVLGVDAQHALEIGQLQAFQSVGGLEVLPVVVAIPRPEMAGKTLSALSGGGLALFPIQVMSLLDSSSSLRKTIELPTGPVEVEVVQVDDHQIWGPTLTVFEQLIGVLSA